MKPSKEAIEAASRGFRPLEERLEDAYAIDFAQLEQQLRENAKARPSPAADLHALCDQLGDVWNDDDTPDELSQLALSTIEDLWKQRDQLRASLEEAQRENMMLDFQFNDLKSKVDEIVSQEKYQLEKDLAEASALLKEIEDDSFGVALGTLERIQAFLSRRKKETTDDLG